MARTGRPKARLELTEDEREQLESWARRRTSSQALAQRSRIVLACAAGADNQSVAAQERVGAAMVGKWRARFVRDRLDGLVDEPRSGRPRTIDDAKVEGVIVRTLETEPRDAAHWSTACVRAAPRRTGRRARWPRRPASRARRSGGSGARSGSSLIAWRRGSSRGIRC